MIITIDTEHPPTPLEFKHLGSLLYDIDPDIDEEELEIEAATQAIKEQTQRVKAKRTAKKAAPATEQTVQQQAIALATRLVSEDKTDVVREALTSIGESRVSLLTEEQATAFLEAVGE